MDPFGLPPALVIDGFIGKKSVFQYDTTLVFIPKTQTLVRVPRFFKVREELKDFEFFDLQNVVMPSCGAIKLRKYHSKKLPLNCVWGIESHHLIDSDLGEIDSWKELTPLEQEFFESIMEKEGLKSCLSAIHKLIESSLSSATMTEAYKKAHEFV